MYLITCRTPVVLVPDSDEEEEEVAADGELEDDLNADLSEFEKANLTFHKE